MPTSPENVAGLRMTQAFDREPANRTRYAALSRAFRNSRLRAQRNISIYFPFVQALSTVAGAMRAIIATGEIRDSTLTAGALIAYLLYLDLLFSPVQQLSQVFDSYQQAMVGLGRITELLRLGPSTPERAHPVEPGRLAGRIELRDIDFRYGGSGANALTGINLVIEAGETVALVGADRGGQVHAGQAHRAVLRRDGRRGAGRRDRRARLRPGGLPAPARRGAAGVLPVRRHGQGGDRLCAGRTPATPRWRRPPGPPGRTRRSCECRADTTTRSSERGRNLSAGQRQLIALARAQLADPAILLLDEATAALDLAAEAAVNRAIAELTSARTTIVVAHRLTTAARADRIVVLDQGQITETGSHDELLAMGGTYAALWAAFTGESELVA